MISTLPAPIVKTEGFENGDHLSRREFHRRYLKMPEVKGAELIEGIVFMPSPVRRKKHGRPHQVIGTWIGNYEIATPGTESLDNCSVFLDDENEPQPDTCLRILPDFGGQTKDTPDDYVEGAPELIVEISGSSASVDLHRKKRAYQRNGVREYVVWLTEEQRFRWFVLRGSEYAEIEPDEGGVYRSEVFPGLWLDAKAALQFDLRAVAQTLADGASSQEHVAFCAQLSK